MEETSGQDKNVGGEASARHKEEETGKNLTIHITNYTNDYTTNYMNQHTHENNGSMIHQGSSMMQQGSIHDHSLMETKHGRFSNTRKIQQQPKLLVRRRCVLFSIQLYSNHSLIFTSW